MKKIVLWIFILTLFDNTVWASYLGTFKLLNGVFKYSSDELSGNASTMGSPSIGFLKPLNERHQLGVSIDIFFNTSAQSVALYGTGLIYKYSIKGLSSYSLSETQDFSISSSTKWEHYLLSTFKRYTYFLGSNKSEESRFDQNGNFFNFDFGLGSSFDVGNRTRITAELSNTFISLASSDNRIKFKSILLSFGLQKEF